MSQKSTLSIKEASYDTIDYNNSSQQSNWFTNLTNGDWGFGGKLRDKIDECVQKLNRWYIKKN